jgi:hypothetical protein
VVWVMRTGLSAPFEASRILEAIALAIILCGLEVLFVRVNRICNESSDETYHQCSGAKDVF